MNLWGSEVYKDKEIPVKAGLQAGNTIPQRESADEQLMQLICQGNVLAFEILYDRYFRKLAAYAYSFLGDGQQAEDAVQEVFLKIVENPRQFELSKRFSTWVYTVTGNACKNILRNKDRRNRILEQQVKPGLHHTQEQGHTLDSRYIREQVQLVYAVLTDKEKNIFVLRFEQELSIKEISEILGIPEGSVKSGLFYLLRKFAGQLKELSHE